MKSIGISLGILLGSTYLTKLRLGPLTLTANTIQENSAPGTLVGYILGKSTLGVLSIVDSAGGRFNLVGDMLVAGSVATDFETSQSHSITIRETSGGSFTRDSVLTINVLNQFEQPTLSELSLSQTIVNEGETTTFLIVGATAGSTLSGTLPAGLTLNSAARTITGTLTETLTFNLVETLADSPNSPRTTSLTITVFTPSLLFTAGEQGVWYDQSDFSTMFQDHLGTTPVTAVGQTVGFIGDKSQGLVLGPELVTNGDFSGARRVGTRAVGGRLRAVQRQQPLVSRARFTKVSHWWQDALTRSLLILAEFPVAALCRLCLAGLRYSAPR